MGMDVKNRGCSQDDWPVHCSFPLDGWREAARSCGALRRARRVRDEEVLLRLLLVPWADGCSLHETAQRARQAQASDLSAVAIFLSDWPPLWPVVDLEFDVLDLQRILEQLPQQPVLFR